MRCNGCNQAEKSGKDKDKPDHPFPDTYHLGSAHTTQVSLAALWAGRRNMGSLLNEMFPPDWHYFSSVTKPMLATIRMAILGTTFGGIAAIPVALLASSNVVKIPVIYQIARVMMNLIRTLPELLLAALFVPVFGIGEIQEYLRWRFFHSGSSPSFSMNRLKRLTVGRLNP